MGKQAAIAYHIVILASVVDEKKTPQITYIQRTFTMTNSSNLYEDLLERIWTDEDFKKRFIADPKSVLVNAGVKVSDSLVKIEVHEDGPNLRNYVLPAK